MSWGETGKKKRVKQHVSCHAWKTLRFIWSVRGW
jgi:hypothetical protein